MKWKNVALNVCRNIVVLFLKFKKKYAGHLWPFTRTEGSRVTATDSVGFMCGTPIWQHAPKVNISLRKCLLYLLKEQLCYFPSVIWGLEQLRKHNSNVRGISFNEAHFFLGIFLNKQNWFCCFPSLLQTIL